MCGIAGYILKKNFVSSQGIEILSERMANSIRHRGPDDIGFWTDKNIGVSFAFRRLAIRDTSTKGNQPMFSSDKSFVLIYNFAITLRIPFAICSICVDCTVNAGAILTVE